VRLTTADKPVNSVPPRPISRASTRAAGEYRQRAVWMRIPRVAPLAVDPEALWVAGTAVAAIADGVAAALGPLTAGFGANTGQDAAGEVFGFTYQETAESLLRAVAEGINACRYSAAKIQLCAANYSKAEVASTLGGGGHVLPAPPQPEQFAPPGPPGTLGPGEPAPSLWALVQVFVDDLWPNGDVAGLHAAAGCWRGFGAALSGMQDALNAPKSVIDGQQIVEGDKIQHVLSSLGTDMASIGAECEKLATALDGFADEVAHAQNAIRDLLHRLGSVSGLWDEVLSVFDGNALDEIKKIAADISAVLHNMQREARAHEQAMQLGMQVIDGWVRGMETDMRGVFTHFLGEEVGNPMATVFDTWVNANEGVFKAAVGTLQTAEQLDPRRFLIDPQGAAATWEGMTKTGLINHFLNPQEAVEADKQIFKSLLHLDDWRTDRPGLGFGENLFDIATLVTGAGAVKAGTSGAGAAARGAEVAEEIAEGERPLEGARGAAGEVGEFAGTAGTLGDISRTTSGLTKDLEGLRGDLPKPDSAVGGRPVGLPPPRPPEAPVGPHEPAPSAQPLPAPVPAAPRGHLPSTNPQLAEHMPVTPGGSPVEPAPAPAHSAPTPHASTPQLTPPGAPPPELPATRGLHGPGDSRPPSVQPAPHNGTPGGHQPLPPVGGPEGTGNSRLTISGHGDYIPAHGHINVPKGTTITVYAEHGSTITDDLGNLIETGGDTSGVYSETFRPGEPMPDYTIYPPDGLNIMGTPQTVANPTPLSQLINENMGAVDLAVCPYDATCPTGKVYDVDGIFDEWTGTFKPYERYGF
jgi:hypothetical protein